MQQTQLVTWMGTKLEPFTDLIFTNLDFLTQREEKKSFPI